MAEKQTSPQDDDLRTAGAPRRASQAAAAPVEDGLDDDVVTGRRHREPLRRDVENLDQVADADPVELDGADDGGDVQAQFWLTDAAVTVATAVLEELSSRAGPDGFVGRAVDEALDLVLGEDGNDGNGSTDDGGGESADGDGDESGGDGDGGGDGGGGGGGGGTSGWASGGLPASGQLDDGPGVLGGSLLELDDVRGVVGRGPLALDDDPVGFAADDPTGPLDV